MLNNNRLGRFFHQQNPRQVTKKIPIIVSGEMVLSKPRTITLPPRPGLFKPHESFVYGDELEVENDFRRMVVSHAENVKSFPGATIEVRELITYANTAKIFKELPEKHAFEATPFCPMLFGMIERQQQGESEDLLRDGFAVNIFYVSAGGICTVFVPWVGKQRWAVKALPFSGGHWPVGSRVFSPEPF